MDFLLTWNCKHIASPFALRTIDPCALVKMLTPINQILELPQNAPVKLAFAT